MVAQSPIALLLQSSQPAESRDAATPQRITSSQPASLNLDELIDRLPTVIAEGKYDSVKQEWVDDPYVAEMSRRIQTGVDLTQAQWYRALTRTQMIAIREKWPKALPISVCMQEAPWLPATEIRLTPRTKDLKPLSAGTLTPEHCGNAAFGRQRFQMDQELGRLPLGKHQVQFDAEIEMGGRWWRRDGGRMGLIWKGVLAFDVEIVETLEQAIPPLNDAAVEAAIRDSIGVCTSPWGQDLAPVVLLVFDADTRNHPDLSSLALSIRIEFRRRGITRDSQVMTVHQYDDILRENSIYDGAIRLFSFARVSAFPAESFDNPRKVADWSIRVTGTDKDVLKLWHAKHRWNGSFEVPLTEAIKRECERMGGKPQRTFSWMP